MEPTESPLPAVPGPQPARRNAKRGPESNASDPRGAAAAIVPSRQKAQEVPAAERAPVTASKNAINWKDDHLTDREFAAAELAFDRWKKGAGGRPLDILRLMSRKSADQFEKRVQDLGGTDGKVFRYDESGRRHMVTDAKGGSNEALTSAVKMGRKVQEKIGARKDGYIGPESVSKGKGWAAVVTQAKDFHPKPGGT